jgi:tripartite-type tricarboxylate transporter receptor subunit TctC
MPIGFCVRLVATAIAGLGLTATIAAAQEAVEPFFKGKQIAVVVGSSPVGGYDTYARLLARHFGSAIPGGA